MATFKITEQAFLVQLRGRPALVKILTNPNDELLIKVLRENIRAFDYLTEEQKTTPVCNAWVTKYGKSWSTSVWIKTAENDFLSSNIEIPAFVLASDDFMVAYLSSGSRIIEDSRWNPDLVRRVISIAPNHINKLPEHFITRDIVDMAVKVVNSPLKLSKFLPESVWNENQDQLAEDLVSLNPTNLQYIPDQYRTAKACLIAVRNTASALISIPKELLTTEMLLLALQDISTNHLYYQGFYPKTLLNDPDFLFAAAAQKHGYGKYAVPPSLETLLTVFKVSPAPSTWLKLLQNCPQAIQLVEKKDQTTEMIETAIQYASPEGLAIWSFYLNKTKITKDMITLLLGIKGFEDLVNRKLNGPTRSIPPQNQNQDSKEPTVLVKMSQKQFDSTFSRLK